MITTQTLDQSETMLLDQQYVMYTYARLPVVFVRGDGCNLWDESGKRYLDMVAGIAVCGLGHCAPKVIEAIREQVGILMHTSNLYHTQPQPRLAKMLVELSGMSKAFFCNSGAEANEAAIKLARKASKAKGYDDKIKIITAEKSFHGRTFAALTATGQAKYHSSFTPLVPGFEYVPYNDVEALAAVVDKQTCAVMLEPIQGESGVHIATAEYLWAARNLCNKFEACLIFDEVQTGLGRTGKLFGYQHSGVVPDVMTLAKTLGGGFPIGACLACGTYADVFVPGDHASTFGGNPLACSASLAAVEEILGSDLTGNAERVGAYLRGKLASLPDVKEVRGLGLMIAVEFNTIDVRKVGVAALGQGLIVNWIGERVIRLVPPLILTTSQADECCAILQSIVKGA